MINDLTDSVVRKTFQLTDDNSIHTLADDVKQKFLTLNTQYSRVHKHPSHKDPVRENETDDIEDSISMNMTFYRARFPDVRIIPKQHILEAHCVQGSGVGGLVWRFMESREEKKYMQRRTE